MIKPIQTAGIAMLLGVLGLPLAQAQTPAQNAAREVVRRQAAIIELRNKLACVAPTQNVSRSHPASAWPSAVTSPKPTAHGILPVAYAVLEANPFSMN